MKHMFTKSSNIIRIFKQVDNTYVLIALQHRRIGKWIQIQPSQNGSLYKNAKSYKKIFPSHSVREYSSFEALVADKLETFI